jgi:hypothetical protein
MYGLDASEHGRISPFRILSLDGGGIKGVFTASVISNFEQMLGHSLARYFDLIVGTSTGGIIALALGLGLPGQDILTFYREHGPFIFPSTGIYRRVGNAVRHVFTPKHSSEILKGRLGRVFGSRRLGESITRLAIPCFDCNAGHIQMFKTSHHPRFVQDYKLPVVNIALATSAAPTYFSAFTSNDGQSYLDGGVWANCPIMVGLLEAIFVLNVQPESVHILSIGTTDTPFDVARRRRVGGLLSWRSTLVSLLLQAQVDAAMAQALLVTKRRTIRINATTRDGRFRLDDARQIAELSGLGAYHAKETFQDVADRFFGAVVEPFEPYHRL